VQSYVKKKSYENCGKKLRINITGVKFLPNQACLGAEGANLQLLKRGVSFIIYFIYFTRKSKALNLPRVGSVLIEFSVSVLCL
jgi:hypothetical protein